MKMFLLAAAAVVAMPALAQTGTQSGTSMPDSATPAQPTTPPADSMQTAPATPADTANPAGTTTQAPMPATPTTGDPVGGYQPSSPPMTGAMTPGTTPVFRAAPTPSEAYPAPAPLASYPICRPGQFDKCMQGPHSTHSRQVRGRPSR